MRKAIYAFSGDPITFGHLDIIKRTARNFDEVTVAIGSNPDKHYMFSLQEREKMARNALKSVKNVKVISFRGLLVDYAYEQDISVLVKGVRNSIDFDYENILHQVGESQKLGIDTFILIAKPHLSHISSSAVKAIIKEQGYIHDYVPLSVKQRLETKICNQLIIGITGEIGTGKSFVSNKIVSLFQSRKEDCHNIDLDVIGHQILGDLEEPQYRQVRKEIISHFGKEVSAKNGMIDRKHLGQIVFGNSESLKVLNEIMQKPILVRLKRELYGKSGVILLNGGLLAEGEMLKLCNNNVILITCDKNIQRERIKRRGLSPSQQQRRIESQYSFEEKKKKISKCIKNENHGNMWIIDNSGDGVDQEISKLLKLIEKQWKG